MELQQQGRTEEKSAPIDDDLINGLKAGMVGPLNSAKNYLILLVTEMIWN
ncbi:hypothetical protein [Virgibacillus proomii]|nr:hypothetical protein [Virgibacillus proomii]MBU5266700.1 hypothetical protein [Virgibacillus proomii]